MKSLSLLVVPVLLLAVPVGAQEHSGLKSSKVDATQIVDRGPVTCAEASKVFAELQKSCAVSVGATNLPAFKFPESTERATRTQLIAAFDQLERRFEPFYTLKPRTQYCNLSAIKLQGDGRTQAVRLIKLGFLEPVAPLITGPEDTLGLVAFSEAVGAYIARFSDMTHLPATQWSPDLMLRPSMPTPRAAQQAPVPSAAPRRRAS